MECYSKNNIIPLATGDIESLTVDWREKLHYSRKDGVEALSKVKGSKINSAHDALIKAASSDDSELRIATLNSYLDSRTKSGSCLIISVFYLMIGISM